MILIYIIAFHLVKRLESSAAEPDKTHAELVAVDVIGIYVTVAFPGQMAVHT